jgi:glycogen debranching enzyme
MTAVFPHLTCLNPPGNSAYISQGRTVLITAPDGFFQAGGTYGLFVYQTRLLSHYRYRINSLQPQAAGVANVSQHSSLGYYFAPTPGSGQARSQGKESSEHAVELRLSRFAGEGFHEDATLTNYTGQAVDFHLHIELDADFADLEETREGRQQKGRLIRTWGQVEPGAWEIGFDYRAEHAFNHQGEYGTARIHRGLIVRIENASSRPTYVNKVLHFRVKLVPQESWHVCLSFIPVFEGERLPLRYRCRAFFGQGNNDYDRKRERFLDRASRFETPGSQTLAADIAATLEQAKHDLAALRLYDLDQADNAWTVAAGLPIYVGLFGRDTLMTGWQAGPLSADLLRGVLPVLPRYQGREVNDWRDEQPGRLPHQVQAAPLSALNYNPLGRYYGTMSASAFYPEILYALWLWTADRGLIQAYLDPALRALHWLDTGGDIDGDGFYEWQTRSKKGLKNQGWKDSGESFIYEDGSIVPDPIASADVQACVYIAKKHLAQVLRWLDRGDEARTLLAQAEELKKRFNDAFWMDDGEYLCLGLDPDKRQIRSISSDAGACLAADILDVSRVRRAADRLMEEDMFSGWGVRTLSAQHRAYNPFSYQRGSVWPVENGIVALAFLRFGLFEHLHRLTRGMFEAAQLFGYHRLPEVFAGHARDEEHPFPGLYPEANWPQAWSCSAVFTFAQSLLGLFPYAPLDTLVVDPHLPDWLPEITVRNLHIGAGVSSIRFFREHDGDSNYEVLDSKGSLHVVRQPSPWSLMAGLGERIEDALLSVLPSV